MYVESRFSLNSDGVSKILQSKPTFGFDGFGEAVYFRTYSRLKPDGTQESWHDTVLRVVNGMMSIRKDWMAKHHLPWDESWHQGFAALMGKYMVEMKWLPPGRGLWAMGTDFVFDRGSAALYNCAAVSIRNDHLDKDMGWIMDMLMNGVGVGIECVSGELELHPVQAGYSVCYTIPDSREGWVESVEMLLRAYMQGGPDTEFDYSLIRPAGSLIAGFGGVACGPGPLRDLHDHIRWCCEAYIRDELTRVQFVADIANGIGCCVVAGNVRRSAEILLGEPEDDIFINLKNQERYPYRKDWMWMSNNSIRLSETSHFELLPQIAERIRENGEPGLLNLINVQKFGRIGRPAPDRATLVNPCGEIPLESFETCNLAEVNPTRCVSKDDFLLACDFAAFYCSTVALLPTHREETNAVLARNRRIGVSLAGVTQWLEKVGSSQATRWMRDGYKRVQLTNQWTARQAGVPYSHRLTTLKPSGTVSHLMGGPPGAHWPTHQFAIRRMRVGMTTPYADFLVNQGVPHEPDIYSKNTWVFEFPIRYDMKRAATDVSAWEQLSLTAMLGAEWADNAVSVTTYFNPDTEATQVEQMLAQYAPRVKSLTMLPHTKEGVYAQSPYEGIDEQTYRKRMAAMPEIDWNRFSGSDGQDEKFCTGDKCMLTFA